MKIEAIPASLGSESRDSTEFSQPCSAQYGSSAITAAMCRGTAQIAARVGAASVHRAEAWPARSGMWLQKLGAAMALVLSGAAVAQSPPTPADCDRPVYLAFETGSMEVAPLVAVILLRQQVHATFFAAADRTPDGDTLATQWAPWWKSRGAEAHDFVSHTRDRVAWLGDDRTAQPRFLVRPALGAFAGRTFTWDAAKYCENIEQAADRLTFLTGHKALPLFRAPGGRLSAKLVASAKACGYQHVGLAPIVFPPDAAPSAKGPSDKQVAQTVSRVRPGDLILAPLGVWSRDVPQVPVGLDPLISGLKAQGFCFRTLREHPLYRDWIAAQPR